MVFAGPFYHCGYGAYTAGLALDYLLFAWVDTPMKSKIYVCDECNEIRCTVFVTYFNRDEIAFKKIPTTCVLADMGLERDVKWTESKAYD